MAPPSYTLTINSTYRLPSGHSIPILGYGVFQSSQAECASGVLSALNSGYRHIDSATTYHNEAACAAGIRASGLARSSIFFTSKVYSNASSYASTTAQIDSTLRETGFEYIDLMLMHTPFGTSAGRKAAWRALVDAVGAGKVRSIGISNYGVHHLDELERHVKELEVERGPGGGGVISVAQYELQPWLSHLDIVSWCRARSIVVQAFCPLIRAQRFDDPLLLPIVKRTGKTRAQVLMRWSLQMGFCPLPKSVRKERIIENANVYDFELTEGEMKSLDTGKYENCAWDPTIVPLDGGWGDLNRKIPKRM